MQNNHNSDSNTETKPRRLILFNKCLMVRMVTKSRISIVPLHIRGGTIEYELGSVGANLMLSANGQLLSSVFIQTCVNKISTEINRRASSRH